MASFVIEIYNKSLSSETFPNSMKCAFVIVILKKNIKNPSVLSNYEPMSAVTFLPKLSERCVYERFINYLNDNNSFVQSNQSAYQLYHLTETTILCVVTNVLTSADSGHCTLFSTFP